MTPTLLKTIVGLIAVALMGSSQAVGDPMFADLLVGVGGFLAGWAGLRRPGDALPEKSP